MFKQALGGLLKDIFPDVAEDMARELFGAYLGILLFGGAFVFFLYYMCHVLNEASMSQEEWDEKHKHDTEKSVKADSISVAIFAVMMVGAGFMLYTNIEKLNEEKAKILYNSTIQQKDEPFLGIYDNGHEAYLMAGTVQYVTEVHADGTSDGYSCIVKSIDSSAGEVYYDYYELTWYQVEALVKNGKGYGLKGMSKIYEMPNSVEMKLIYYLRDLHEKEHGNSVSKNPSDGEYLDSSPEDRERAGRLIMCGYWKGDNGTNLSISTDKIVKFDAKTHKEGESFSYSVRSINKNADEVTIRATFSEGENFSFADLIFKDMDTMILSNYSTKEGVIYNASNDPYPQHLDHNLQYILLYGHMGAGFYMDLETLQVISDTEWSVNIVSANVNNGRRENMPRRFSVRNNIPSILRDNGSWSAINLKDLTGSNMLAREAFLTSYYYAFGRNF